jgi:hypothetical protein
MAFGTHQHLSGLLRGFLLRPHELAQTVDELWRQMPTPRESYAKRIAEYCRLRSKGKPVLQDPSRLHVGLAGAAATNTRTTCSGRWTFAGKPYFAPCVGARAAGGY